MLQVFGSSLLAKAEIEGLAVCVHTLDVDAALGLLRLGDHVFGFRNGFIVHVQDHGAARRAGLGHLALAHGDDLDTGPEPHRLLLLIRQLLQPGAVEGDRTVHIRLTVLRGGGVECDFGREFLSVADIVDDRLVARMVVEPQLYIRRSWN